MGRFAKPRAHRIAARLVEYVKGENQNSQRSRRTICRLLRGCERDRARLEAQSGTLRQRFEQKPRRVSLRQPGYRRDARRCGAARASCRLLVVRRALF